MAECTELMESRKLRLQEVASAVAEDDGNLAEKMQEMVLPSVLSIAESLNPDNSHPTQILLGKDNTAISGCNFNITNIYGGDNGALQKSSVTEVGAPSPLPSRPVHKPDESQAAAKESSSVPSPKWTKSNEEMILRVVPLATEMEDDCDGDLILVVWICWDDDKTFQKIVISEHDSGNVTLDSYDTIIVRKPVGESWNANTITIHVSTYSDYSWGPRQYNKRIQCSQVWNAQRAKCSFRIQKNPDYPESQLMYITLLIQQNNDPTDTQFILRKRISDIRMPKEQKRDLLQLLDTKILQSSTMHSYSVQDDDGDGDDRQGFCGNRTGKKSSFTCWAIPYVDKLFNIDDDVIITLWLCWFDERGKLLEALKGEQKLYSRKVLDTENSFVLANSEENIRTKMIHNGYFDGLNLDGQKVIAAQRIVQGMRAKFQFVSKRLENSYEYADRMAHQIGKKKLSKMEKRLLSGNSRKMYEANNLLPKVKADKLDIEIITRQGDQEPIEFRKVTEMSRFFHGRMKKSSKRRVPLGVKSCIKKAFKSLKSKPILLAASGRDLRTDVRHIMGASPMPESYGYPRRAEAQMMNASTDWEMFSDMVAQGPRMPDMVAEGLGMPDMVAEGLGMPDMVAEGLGMPDMVAQGPRMPGTHISDLYNGQDSAGYADLPSYMYIPDPQQHVLRLHIFASQDSDCENALTMHVVMGTLNSTNSHNLTEHEVHGWTAIDSFDTFLLTSQVGGCYNPLVKVTFEVHQTSHWLPESDKMVVDVKEILKEGRVKCSCRFLAISDSQSDFFYGTMRIWQTVGKSKEAVRFVIKKKVEDIQSLRKEASSSILENIISPVKKPEDANEGVMLDEYQTCLAVSYVDLIQDITDDIILTVWVCSIQQSKTDFRILCEDQKKFMKIQLDTENSFIFFSATSPVYAKVECHGLWTVEEPLKKVDPRRIRKGGRAKFQFICKRGTNDNSNKFDVEITIRQNRWNQVQFMTRKKIELFLQHDLPTNIQDTGTEIN